MELEKRTMRRVAYRIMPLLCACYFAAYLDRVNVSIAALTMNQDIALGPTAYGLGVGMFFITYLLCEIPSNLILYRVGARRWIARIMLTWGLCAAGSALIIGPASFYAARLLLGAAEAGFHPGVIFYLTLWFPRAYRARMIAIFIAAVPISNVIGAPISGFLLSLNGFGLAGWQWLFLIEALPSLILGLVVLVWLPDKPEQAQWLPEAEREWLVQRLATERREISTTAHPHVFQSLATKGVFGLGLVYFAIFALNTGIAYFLPQAIAASGFDHVQTGMLTSIPYLCGFAAMIYWGAQSDRRNERVVHVSISMVVGAVGLIAAALISHPFVKVAAFCVALAGTSASTGPFWAMVTSRQTGKAAAGAIAAVSAIGALGGIVSPFIIGYMTQRTGTLAAGQITAACIALAGAFLLLALPNPGAGQKALA